MRNWSEASEDWVKIKYKILLEGENFFPSVSMRQGWRVLGRGEVAKLDPRNFYARRVGIV